MKQKIYSILVFFIFSVCMFLFFSLYQSSLLYEDMRVIINNRDNSPNALLGFEKPNEKASYFYDTYLQNPANLELYLRGSILKSDNNNELALFYRRLLKTRPTWPYYFSGVAQSNHLSGHFEGHVINSVIKYGRYERKVVYSMADILFHNWDDVKKIDRELILNYISGQQEYIITQTVNISLKFAKIYEYCDFIYEKKHVEYAACKKNYWQPLSD